MLSVLGLRPQSTWRLVLGAGSTLTVDQSRNAGDATGWRLLITLWQKWHVRRRTTLLNVAGAGLSAFDVTINHGRSSKRWAPRLDEAFPSVELLVGENRESLYECAPGVILCRRESSRKNRENDADGGDDTPVFRVVAEKSLLRAMRGSNRECDTDPFAFSTSLRPCTITRDHYSLRSLDKKEEREKRNEISILSMSQPRDETHRVWNFIAWRSRFPST